jgi:hypothetical protein
MPIIQAQAKLYQGFRSYVVDKNISANLSASFTIGNQNQPSPTLDVNGNIILQSGIKVAKIVRTIADLLCPRPKPTLVDQRYKTYGGGNNVINADGSVNNTNNSKIVSTLVCSFPTFFRLDLEALGLPEGTDCVVKLEEGFVIEDRGLIRASGTYPYPLAVSNPNPASDSFATFRTPKTFAKKALSVVASLSYNIQRIRPYAANLTSAMSFVVRLKYANANGISLTGGAFFILPTAVKTSRAVAALTAVFGPRNVGGMPEIAIPSRILPTANIPMSATTLFIPDTYFARRRRGSVTMDPVTFMNTEATRNIGPITFAPQTSTSTLVCNIRKFSGFTSTPPSVFAFSAAFTRRSNIQQAMVATASMSISALKLVRINANIVATSSVSVSAQRPMVIHTSNGVGQFGLYGTVNATIQWADGTEQVVTTPGSYSYDPGAPYVPGVITIRGTVTKYGPGNTINGTGQGTYAHNSASVSSFGDIGLTHLDYAFRSGSGGQFNGYLPERLPSTVTSLKGLLMSPGFGGQWTGRTWGHQFGGADGRWPVNGINKWVTTNVTDMSYMFHGQVNMGFHGHNWDMSNVTNISYMFYRCSGALQTQVQSEHGMNVNGTFTTFHDVTVGDWNVSNVTNMDYFSTNSVNDPQSANLSKWCVSNIPSQPAGFILSGFNNSQYPVWGTCPARNPYIINLNSGFEKVVNAGLTPTHIALFTNYREGLLTQLQLPNNGAFYTETEGTYDRLVRSVFTDEVSGSGYTRLSLSSGTNTYTFNIAASQWGFITHLALVTASTGGQTVKFQPIRNARLISNGDIIQVTITI